MAGRSRSLVNMKTIAALTDPDSVRTYRERVGPPRSSARGGTAMRRHHNKLLSRVTQTAVVLALVSASSVADVFQFNSKRDWETWTFPPGVLVTNNDGSITLSRVDKAINAVSNSTDFLHKVKRTRDLIPGGIRGFSNESAVENSKRLTPPSVANHR